MKNREPTPFEFKVLKGINRTGRVDTGNAIVQYVAAARRLEKLGYAFKGYYWYVTGKGAKYLNKQAALVAWRAKFMDLWDRLNHTSLWASPDSKRMRSPVLNDVVIEITTLSRSLYVGRLISVTMQNDHPTAYEIHSFEDDQLVRWQNALFYAVPVTLADELVKIFEDCKE